MKGMILTLIALAAAGSAFAEGPARAAAKPDAETALNVAAEYLDHTVTDTLASLELVAMTPAARAGDWEGIKPYLRQLEGRLPGVYFYVLPNGDYYSVALDFTNLNLADRAYFGPLFSGQRVKGFPITSRSSGRRSALVATPVMDGDEVTGALGASIFLEALHTRMNRALALPPDQTWFVVNADGETMLDREGDFIFMNALTDGSDSLREAVSTALQGESGRVQYEFAGAVRNARYRRLPNTDWWLFLAEIEGGAPQPEPRLKVSLDRFVPALQARLQRLDAAMSDLLGHRQVDAGDEQAIRKLLTAVLDRKPAVVNAAFIDDAGVMRFIEPRDYRNFEGADIRDQQQVAAMLERPRPIFSKGFKAVEGFLAVDVSYPLYDAAGAFTGAVSALVHPKRLVEELLAETQVPEGYELWVMQPDGLILYDQDEAEIGRNLFTDPMYAGYEGLLKLGRAIAAAPAGRGSYVFAGPDAGERVAKDALWRTVRLHGRSWRVVLAYRPYE